MSDREKLIELLDETFDKQYDRNLVITARNTADHLISNGVTVQKWIPVSKRLPTEEDADENGFVLAYTVENKKIIALWGDVCRFAEFVTHWMPLPKPPKECD